MPSNTALPAYSAVHPARSTFVDVRSLSYHVHQWGSAELVTPSRPPLVLVHGWMDVGASFQFLVDALAAVDGFQRWVLAPDWRGFGLTATPGADTYWFADYLADLDALLDQLLPLEQFGAIDLAGHSMGGNVVMSYAGVRPERIRRLVNLEGFGLPRTQPEQAPARLRQWLDELKSPSGLRDYDSLAAVAARLQKNNPRLGADKAAWLAPRWAAPGPDGRWVLQGHPAHKRINPVLYNVDEVLAAWRAITAPVLSVQGEQTDPQRWWGQRYSLAEFQTRLAEVPDVRSVTLAQCGHMLHHDQPEALATHLKDFLG